MTLLSSSSFLRVAGMPIPAVETVKTWHPMRGAALFELPEAIKPEQTRSIERPRSVLPFGAAGMIGLVLAIESFVTRNWLDFSDPVSLSWRYSVQTTRTEAPGCDLLCLGDSLVKNGIIPSILASDTGRRTVNISAARCPTLMSYFLLRRALDAGAQPEAIFINAKPAVLLGNVDFNARYLQEVLSIRECVELLCLTRRGPFVLSTLVGRALPSLRSRLELRSNLMSGLRGRTDPLFEINRVLWRNWTVNGGANVAPARASSATPVDPPVAWRLHTGVFHVDPTNAAAIDRLLQLAAERNIAVFWLLPPLSPELQALRDHSGAEAAYERFVRSYQSRYSQVMAVLDGRRAGYPSALFSDATHLNSQGAVSLTHAVATAIGLELNRTRPANCRAWIALGAPRNPPAGPGVQVEDLEETRGILQFPSSAAE
jgi:hypothetical protein